MISDGHAQMELGRDKTRLHGRYSYRTATACAVKRLFLCLSVCSRTRKSSELLPDYIFGAQSHSWGERRATMITN